MGQAGVELQSFCFKVAMRPRVCRTCSPPSRAKQDANSSKSLRTVKREISGWHGKKPGEATGRKIMIVVDSSMEAKGVLQWAVCRIVQSQDVVILLYVRNNAKQGEEPNRETTATEFLQSMMNMCQMKRPEVQIEVALSEGKEKGPAIVEEARKRGITLLILGQKRHSMAWRRLLMTWAGSRVGVGVVEYCIQNAGCMAIAVRRNSRKLGGYLITTKHHKDFWLLA